MSFVSTFNSLPLESLLQRSISASPQAVRESMTRERLALTDFANLISPAAADLLEPMSHHSQQLTRQRFGKVIRLETESRPT